MEGIFFATCLSLTWRAPDAVLYTGNVEHISRSTECLLCCDTVDSPMSQWRPRAGFPRSIPLTSIKSVYISRQTSALHAKSKALQHHQQPKLKPKNHGQPIKPRTLKPQTPNHKALNLKHPKPLNPEP